MSPGRTAQARLERLLHVLPAASRSGGAPVSVLARTLEVEEATIVEDVAEVTARNYYHPGGWLDDVQIGIEGDRIEVRAKGFERPPRLSTEEALCLALALRGGTAGARIRGSAERMRLLERVEAHLALMIQAGISAIDAREARSIWRTSAAARWSILVTFTATLVLSIPVAVGLGVLLSIIFHLESSATDVLVRELVPLDDGRFAEADPPPRLTSGAVTILDVHGSLFFAGARTLEEALPAPAGTERPVVVLRLRGRAEVGATLIDMLDDYAVELEKVGGRLYLSGVEPGLAVQLRRAGKMEDDENVRVVPADRVLGASTALALTQAREWLGRS